MPRLWPHPLDPEPTPRQERWQNIQFGTLVAAIVGGAAVTMMPPIMQALARSAGEPISNCKAIDGDTLRCGRERVRLLGIDAPEMPGHCRRGRRCVSGDPLASKASLAANLQAPLRITRVGEDRYGRTLALVSAASGDLSCRQLAARTAIYRGDWDDGGRVAAICGREVSRARR